MHRRRVRCARVYKGSETRRARARVSKALRARAPAATPARLSRPSFIVENGFFFFLYTYFLSGISLFFLSFVRSFVGVRPVFIFAIIIIFFFFSPLPPTIRFSPFLRVFFFFCHERARLPSGSSRGSRARTHKPGSERRTVRKVPPTYLNRNARIGIKNVM